MNEEKIDFSKKNWIIIAVILILSVLIILALVWRKNQNTEVKRDIQPPVQQSQKSQSKPVQNNNEEGKTEQAGISTLSFDSQEKIVKTNDKLSLKATIDPKGEEIRAAELHIVFDPKVLKLESVDSSDMFPTVLTDAKIDNEKGTASIVLGIQMGKPVTEVTTIAAFNFTVLSSSGNTEVSFSDKTKVAAKDHAKDSVLSSESPIRITIQ